MLQVFWLMIPLSVTMLVNMALGVFEKIGLEKIKWDFNIFKMGIYKAVLLVLAFLGLSFVFNVMDLSELGITPISVITAAIFLYAGKCCKKLSLILGVA